MRPVLPTSTHRIASDRRDRRFQARKLAPACFERFRNRLEPSCSHLAAIADRRAPCFRDWRFLRAQKKVRVGPCRDRQL